MTMDDKLKEQIQDAFYGEYFKAAQQDDNKVFKALRSFFDKADEIAGKVNLSGTGGLLILSFATAALLPPVGIPALIAWTGAMGTSLVGTQKAANRAYAAMEIDIDNGTLPARYHAVLDTKERELAETQALYAAQRAQLPPKGAAVEAFANAGNGNDPAATAPAPAAPAVKNRAP